MARLTKFNQLERGRSTEIVYDDGKTFELSCEYLRVFSPSADVKGHGPGQEVLQTGKENINNKNIFLEYCDKLKDLLLHRKFWKCVYELNHPIAEDKETYIENTLEFLENIGVKGISFLTDELDDNEFINAIHQNWSGALPFTLAFDKNGNLIDYWENKKDRIFFDSVIKKVLSP